MLTGRPCNGPARFFVLLKSPSNSLALSIAPEKSTSIRQFTRWCATVARLQKARVTSSADQGLSPECNLSKSTVASSIRVISSSRADKIPEEVISCRISLRVIFASPGIREDRSTGGAWRWIFCLRHDCVSC